jgi:outer membrane protein assembly factor BamA
LPFALAASGQQFLPKSIQFKGDAEYTEQELLDAAGLKKGVVLTSAEMNDHSKRLMDSGVFDNLTYKFDGQDLVYLLKPSTQLYPVRLENLPLAPGADLDARLHSRLPLYHGKVPSEGSLLDDVRKQLEEILAAQGITTTLTSVPYSDPKKARKGTITAINFSILDPPVQIGAIHLEGVSPALAAKIEPVITEAGKNPFDTENSAPNLENVLRLFYEDQGYAAVKVHAVTSGDPAITSSAIQIPFSVTVEEGRLYKLGTIQLPPEAPVDKADIDKILNGDGSNQAPGIGLRTAWSLIATRYKSKGHLDCAVLPHAQIDETAGTVNYIVDVNPGPVYHLAFVKFDNVSDALRTMLLHNWQMLPGDTFDPSYLATFLFKAQISDPVLKRSLTGVKPKFVVTADPQTHDVNVVVRLEKQP